MDEKELNDIKTAIRELQEFVNSLKGISLDPDFDSNLADKYMKKFLVGTGLSLVGRTLLVNGILKVIAGSGISISPTSGIGEVTITNSQTQGTLKAAAGTASYGPAHNGTSPHITTSDGGNFQPKLIIAFGAQTNVIRKSVGVFAPGAESAWTSDATGLSGNIIHFNAAANLNVQSTDSSGFTWLVTCTAGGDAFDVIWLAIGFA